MFNEHCDTKQDGVCDKSSAPSVSSISRLLRGSRSGSEDGGNSLDGHLDSVHRSDHTINGILASKPRHLIF